MRGAFPGMGPVLSALDIENGNTIAWEIERHILATDGDLLQTDPWQIFEESLADPERSLGPRGSKLFKQLVRIKWNAKSDEKRNLCRFLSRCQLDNDQARYLFAKYELEPAKILEICLQESSRKSLG